MRTPDFNNILKVAKNEVPDRPTLFEFILHVETTLKARGVDLCTDKGYLGFAQNRINAFYHNGYDFATLPINDFNWLSFHSIERERQHSISQGESGVIVDEESYEAYEWPEVKPERFELLTEIAKHVPEGMKIIIHGPCGVLENLVNLIGFEDLCFMLADKPELVKRISDDIGSRLHDYYKCCLEYDIVGMALVNDDWGFKTSTMVSPQNLRDYVIPWHKKIVQTIHDSGRLALLHSCGNLADVWDDIIDDIKFDGKHSYEDSFLPIEDAYEKYGDRIALLGGIDMNFLCSATPDKIYRRSKAMLERSADRGGYALGSGNSIPDYVPIENYLSMTRAALEG